MGLILGILAGVLFLFCAGGGVAGYFIYQSVNTSAEKIASNNNLKQIGLAAHNYHDIHGGLPTNSYSATGQPLLSWRVHILPYVEQSNLYMQFNLNEPWDGPTNKRLLASMPSIYATPEQRKAKTSVSTTFYRGFSNPGAVFARKNANQQFGFDNINELPPTPKGISFGRMTDGLSNTILVIEAGEPVEWTKPDDLDASLGKPFPKLGGIRPKDSVICVGLCDGSVRMMKRTTSETTWRAMISTSGGEAIFE